MPSIHAPSWVPLLCGTLSLLMVFFGLALTSLGGGPPPPCTDDTRKLVVSETTATAKTFQPKQPSSCLIFTHLQKCGGTTIKDVLLDGRDTKWVIYDSPQWQKGDTWRDSFAKALISSGRIVAMGGYTEALRRSTETQDRCEWFTVFRHPIPRLVSAFYYCQKRPQDNLCGTRYMPAEARTDVVAFAKHWGNFGLRQFAMGMVPADDVLAYVKMGEVGEIEKASTTTEMYGNSGWYLLKMYLDGKAGDAVHASEPDSVMYDMLQPAKDLLRERYAVVGILEEFNTTLRLCSAALDTQGMDWLGAADKVANIGTMYEDQGAAVLVDAWASEELKRHIHLDLLLYDYAVELFHAQVQLHGVM